MGSEPRTLVLCGDRASHNTILLQGCKNEATEDLTREMGEIVSDDLFTLVINKTKCRGNYTKLSFMFSF